MRNKLRRRTVPSADAAEHGEEVIIAGHGVPVPKKKFNLGFLKDKVGPVDDSLLFAMTEEQAERFINGQD